MNHPHARDALLEAVCSHLPLMPVDEDRIDGHETKLAPHAQCRKQCCFAETNHGDVDRTADFQQAGFLEVTDDEGVVSCALRVQGIADGLRRAAEFRQRMEEVVGRIEAMDLEPDAGTGGCVEQRLQSLYVGRLLDRMDEALIPQPGGTGRFGHTLSPSINTAPGRRALSHRPHTLRKIRQSFKLGKEHHRRREQRKSQRLKPRRIFSPLVLAKVGTQPSPGFPA